MMTLEQKIKKTSRRKQHDSNNIGKECNTKGMYQVHQLQK